MYKKIVLFILSINLLFGISQKFLEPSEAFKVSTNETKNQLIVTLTLAKDIYVYDEFLKVFNGKEDITSKVDIPKPIKYHDFIVHFNKVDIKIDKKLITNKIIVEYQGCSKAGLCYSPMYKEFDLQKKKSNNTPKVTKTDNITQTLKEGNIFLILATFFGFGLLLAMTPCIFPMIPILSSIIVHHSKQDNGQMSASKGFFLSLIYVLSMSIAYTIAGVIAGLFGANIQAMLQNPYVVISFVLVFIALAFSMFGYYEIGLPQSWQTKLNKTSDKSGQSGGILGIAIMGFLSALIVGPCVAPPLAGALLYIGQTGDAILGGAALFIMSIGMGVPLLIIGFGSGKFMPKPGGWMTTVSKIFGVVMLGVAIWMLDKIVADTITYILFMILCFGSAIYLFRQSNKIAKVVSIALVGVSIFIGYNFLNHQTNNQHLNFRYVKNISELEQIVSSSKKPIMVDFWATWCVSCAEFDKITFQDKNVKEKLKKYLLLKVDVTKNSSDDKALMKKFNLFGPPAMIFYNDGVEQKDKRMIGYKDPQEFLEILK